MSRLTRWAVELVVAALAWFAAVRFLNLGAAGNEVLFALPVYALMTFGCYSLWQIGMSLITFRDFPEAADEMKKEIASTKAELRRRGFRLDDAAAAS